MKWTRSVERRLMQFGFYAIGMAVVGFFALRQPEALNPQWVAVIGLLFLLAGFSIGPRQPKGKPDEKPVERKRTRAEELAARILSSMADPDDEDEGRGSNHRRSGSLGRLVGFRSTEHRQGPSGGRGGADDLAERLRGGPACI